MRNLPVFGRIFYGIAIAGIGLLTIYYHDFPYMLIPAHPPGIPGLTIIAYIFGALFTMAGVCIVFEKKIRIVSLLLGELLLVIFCFYFIPYQFIVSTNFMHFGDWENAAKELALCAGAFVIANAAAKNENPLPGLLEKLISIGTILFAITIISFGIDHYLFAHEAADYVPSWIPWHLFWMYFTGTALLGAGIAILLKIKPALFATLLGAMIFIWVIILHIPRIVVSPIAYIGSEITSTLIALAYSGIAFVIGKKSS